MRAGSYPWQGGNPAPRVKRHGLRKELFISHKYSRFLRAGRFFNFFFPPICFLPFTEFALKIYTSLFSNQTRSAKEKNKTKKPNPYKTLKRPEREVRHSRTPAQRPRFPLSSATHCPPAPSPLSPFAAPKISQILSTCCKFPSSSRAGAQLAPRSTLGKGSSSWGHKPREDGDCWGRATPGSPPRSRVTVIGWASPLPAAGREKFGEKRCTGHSRTPFSPPTHSAALGSPCRASWCPLGAALCPPPTETSACRWEEGGSGKSPPRTPQNEDG